MGIQGREFSVGQILNAATGKVRVPRHQRPYSWDSSELKELWQDLTSFSDNYPGKTIAGRQYFIGSIVGQTNATSAAMEVLDGQQRLATLTVLLCSIRDILHECGRQDLAMTVHNNSIALAPDELDAPDEYILQLGSQDDGYFRQVVQTYPPDKQKDLPAKTASQAAILRAKRFFRAQITEKSVQANQSEADVAQRLHAVIKNHLIVVRVSSDSWDDVADIFERLNDRGKGLSTLDLLRVLLIARSPAAAQGDVEEAWGNVYELSQTAAKVDAFLRHSWITHRGDVKSRSLYKEIKAVLEQGGQPAPLNDSVTFSQSLAADADQYRALLEAKHPDDRCRYWLRAIVTLSANSLLPAALAGLVRGLPDDDYASLLKRLVTTFVRWNILTRGESTELEEAVFAVTKSVRSGESVAASTSLLRPYLRDDSTVADAFKELTLSRTGYQRYVLEALEDKLANPSQEMPVEKPVAGAGTVWVEHIYPQSPSDDWGKWEDHEDYINRVGNLTLLHKKLNAGAKNKGIHAKRAYYASSGLEMNKYLEDLDSWSPSQITKRQELLSEVVATVWPRF